MSRIASICAESESSRNGRRCRVTWLQAAMIVLRHGHLQAGQTGRTNTTDLANTLAPGGVAFGAFERFPPERLSGRCRIGQQTSAGAYGGEGLAP